MQTTSDLSETFRDKTSSTEECKHRSWINGRPVWLEQNDFAAMEQMYC